MEEELGEEGGGELSRCNCSMHQSARVLPFPQRVQSWQKNTQAFTLTEKPTISGREFHTQEKKRGRIARPRFLDCCVFKMSPP